MTFAIAENVSKRIFSLFANDDDDWEQCNATTDMENKITRLIWNDFYIFYFFFADIKKIVDLPFEVREQDNC